MLNKTTPNEVGSTKAYIGGVALTVTFGIIRTALASRLRSWHFTRLTLGIFRTPSTRPRSRMYGVPQKALNPTTSPKFDTFDNPCDPIIININHVLYLITESVIDLILRLVEAKGQNPLQQRRCSTISSSLHVAPNPTEIVTMANG